MKYLHLILVLLVVLLVVLSSDNNYLGVMKDALQILTQVLPQFPIPWCAVFCFAIMPDMVEKRIYATIRA